MPSKRKKRAAKLAKSVKPVKAVKQVPYQRKKEVKSFDPDWKPSSTKHELLLAQFLESHGFSLHLSPSICGFYPDIQIRNTKVLIEVDGAYHNWKRQKEQDAARTKILESYGFKVFRIRNEDINSKRGQLLKDIRDALGIREYKPAEIVAIKKPIC